MSCETCRHYGFYKMITEGPYSYSGRIPCANCVRFKSQEDNYKPIKDTQDKEE